MSDDNKKDLSKSLEDFLSNGEDNCNGDCVIKTDKSLIERINKKVIVEDGRQLLT